MGSTGDTPVPVGDPPTGTSKAVLIGWRCPAHSVRRVAGRHRPVACATQIAISRNALRFGARAYLLNPLPEVDPIAAPRKSTGMLCRRIAILTTGGFRV